MNNNDWVDPNKPGIPKFMLQEEDDDEDPNLDNLFGRGKTRSCDSGAWGAKWGIMLTFSLFTDPEDDGDNEDLFNQFDEVPNEEEEEDVTPKRFHTKPSGKSRSYTKKYSNGESSEAAPSDTTMDQNSEGKFCLKQGRIVWLHCMLCIIYMFPDYSFSM